MWFKLKFSFVLPGTNMLLSKLKQVKFKFSLLTSVCHRERGSTVEKNNGDVRARKTFMTLSLNNVLKT